MSNSDPTRPMPAKGPKAGTPRPERPAPVGSRPPAGSDERTRPMAQESTDPYRDDGGSMGGRKAKRRSPFRGPLIALTVILLTAGAAVGGAWIWLQGAVGPVTLREICTGEFENGDKHTLEIDQADNAAIITAIAEKRDFPVRAATIGVATAIQESKLRNITYGDRDSVGLFQQRPSQGWGTREEILDPIYATNEFYDALAKIGDLDELTITEAAQKVQRSAFPEAYADHEPEARLIVSPLAGHSPGGWNCVLKEDDLAAQQPGENGLTERALGVRAAAKEELGRSKSEVDQAGTGLTFSVPAEKNDRHAWALASWAVARADALGVKQVSLAGHRWVRADSGKGWTETAGDLSDRQVQITVY
ncbi:hypothetical protein LWF15_05530 [Kineosporia rhizophila]|uniref:hypothetical protein n=1 Tax=Kineosporia TaxID=49184 RepID=UPI001E37C9F9|nr:MULTISPECIES: hypothetical protein [Kineosporia]MCE0534963.1 hypothetical protein [Kineosporia rhizophila]GLY14755.1 hypothetical protein Kisp01_17700 [Kineosporia sp. NBRC 101677]